MKLFTWHLRKDLNLRKKWWHRLFLTIYIFSIFIVFFSLLFNPNFFGFFDFPQWKLIDTVENRLGNNLTTLNQLKKADEKIDEIITSSYSLNNNLNEDMFYGVYCSKNIVNYIPEILKKENVLNLELRAQNWVSLEEFNSFILKNNDKCVLVDSYSNYKGISGNKVYFLRPESVFIGGNFSREFGFHKVDGFKTSLFIVGHLFVTLIYVFLIAYLVSIIYHKIILYIIFGKRN